MERSKFASRTLKTPEKVQEIQQQFFLFGKLNKVEYYK